MINKLSPLVDSLSLKKGFFTTKNRSLSHLKDLTKELIVQCDPNKEDGFTNEERVEKLIALRDEAERLSAKKPEGKAVNGNALIDELSRYTKIVQQDQANKAKNEVNVNAERVQQGFAMQQ